MGKKYELLKNDTVTTADGKTLYRIRALRAITNVVKPGDLGGYVETDTNLAHDGNAWVFGDARVYENAWVRGGHSGLRGCYGLRGCLGLRGRSGLRERSGLRGC